MTETTMFNKNALRAKVATQYLRGDGIEIGALGSPLQLPPGTHRHYVDRMSKADLLREYPEMAGRKLVEVDLIDNGETLECLPERSVDFIVANHFMEHCQDFLGTLKTHAGKLLPGGTLFYAIPNREFTFDRKRPNTPFEHLVQDHQAGSHLSREAHYLEWARMVEGLEGEAAVDRARLLDQSDYSVHFHAWDARALFLCLGMSIDFLGLPIQVAHFELNGHEVICVIQQRGA